MPFRSKQRKHMIAHDRDVSKQWTDKYGGKPAGKSHPKRRKPGKVYK